MKPRRSRLPAIIVASGLVSVLLSGCAITGADVASFANGMAMGLDYYEPYQPDVAVYGGWAPGYHVAPTPVYRPRPDHNSGHDTAHPAKAPPPSHTLPSLPTRPHSEAAESREEHPRTGHSKP